jgi:hypothetical protein
VLCFGPSLSLNDLPDDLVYARAEIDDGDGRTVYTQPFELGDPLPPPPPPPGPGPEISALPAGMLALLALLLVVTVNRMAAGSASRG